MSNDRLEFGDHGESEGDFESDLSSPSNIYWARIQNVITFIEQIMPASCKYMNEHGAALGVDQTLEHIYLVLIGRYDG